MHGTVHGHLVMQLVVPSELSFRILADLEYRADDPYAVRFTFHPPGDTPVSWVFSRELLVDGISTPSGEGDVHIHPDGGELSDVCVLLRSPDGTARLRTPVLPLIGFLARTDRLVPMGEELIDGDLEAELAAILENAG